jgi:Tripartite tricarboxylate transporter TctB family
MKINEKDVAAGLLLILVAAAGLYLNLDHSLGSARRMGPGYMPALVFLLLAGLGILVLVIGLFNGPDPLDKWTGIDWTSLAVSIVAGVIAWQVSLLFGEFFTSGYNGLGFGLMVGFFVMCWAQGWRLMGFVLASMCAFALLLERGGLVAATIGTVVVSSLADVHHHKKPLGVAGMTIFLVALCWWIFIKQLDIRVPVWPQF